MKNISHVEIAGVYGDHLKDFYQTLFNWEVTSDSSSDATYHNVETGNNFSGGIRPEPNGKAEIVIYYEVDDLDESVETATSMGASVRIPPMEYNGLNFALIEDPEGNPVGLTQKKS